jgi:hypothetical protein
MERRNELLDAWIGEAVAVKTLRGPRTTDEDFEYLLAASSNVKVDAVEVLAKVVEFVAYDSFGVVLRERREGAHRYFVSWSAVLSIEGFDPDVTRAGE